MSKIRDLPEKTNLDDTDLFYTVDTSEGPNGGRKITKSNLKENVSLTESEVKTKYENNSNTNAFTDADKSKLDGIEANAKDDQNASEVPYDNSSSVYTASEVQTALDQTSTLLSDSNVVTVSKDPGPGQFSSVKAAVDSITTASATNPITVSIGPGIFVEDTITLKPYIALVGTDDSQTILEASNSTSSIIIGVHDSEIKQVTIRGATDTGTPAIFYQGISSTLNPFSIIECAFGSNDILIKAESASFPTIVRVEGVRVLPSAVFGKGIVSDRAGSGPTQIFVGTFIFQKQTAPFPQSIFEVSNGARLIVDTTLIELTNQATDGIIVQNGAILDIIYCAIGGANRGLYVPNIGSAPTINTSDLVLRDSTADVQIDHPGTLGNFSGIANSDKVNIHSDSTISATYVDVENGGSTYSGPFRLGRTQSSLTEVRDLIESAPTMGVLNGGQLTNGGGLTVDIAAGFGYLMFNSFPEHELERLDWSAQSLTLSPNQDVYIYFNSSGILVSNSSYPVTSSNIVLGRVVTGSTEIELIENIPLDNHHFGNDADLFFREAFGPVYSSGSSVSESSTPFKIDITSGEYFLSTNRLTPSGDSEITFMQLYRDGVGGFISTDTDLVNNTHYDDGYGSLEPLTPGYFARHSLYLSGSGTDVQHFLVISQAEYPSSAAAVTASDPLPPNYFRGAVVQVASIIVQEGTSNISSIVDSRPTLGFRAGSLSSTSDHGNLTGLDDDDHPQYFLTNGNKPLTGHLDMGGNSVTNVNLVDGVDVSNHSSRHLPNGADPLTTAAPTSNLNGLSNNTIGINNSFARSDHSHAIDNATTSVAGLISASDKTKLDGIEANAKDDQNASEVSYDNSTSGLSASEVQSAIDEIDGRLDPVESDLNTHLDGYSSKHDATEIDYERLDGAKIDIQASSDDVETALTDLDDNKLSRSGSQAMTGSLDLNSNRIINVADPQAGTDAVNRDYVNSLINGLTWQDEVIDRDLTSPPGSPTTGDRYIVANPASGDWLGHDEEIAEWDGSQWNFIIPTDGFALYVDDEDLYVVFNGTSWVRIGSVFDHGVLQGLGDDDHTQYLRHDGYRPMSGDLDMGGNSVTNVNLVDGVDVSNHSTRHLPNGADPITTAAPATNLNGNTTNSTGTANSLARSDHTHAIDNATQSVAGLMSATDKFIFDTIFIGYDEIETVQTTTSTTYVQALRLTVNVPQTNNYVIEWYAEVYSTAKDRTVQLRIQVDDTTTLGEFAHGRQNDILTPEPYCQSGFRRLNLSAGSHDIDFDYRAVSNTAGIRRVRLMVKRF